MADPYLKVAVSQIWLRDQQRGGSCLVNTFGKFILLSKQVIVPGALVFLISTSEESHPDDDWSSYQLQGVIKVGSPWSGGDGPYGTCVLMVWG